MALRVDPPKLAELAGRLDEAGRKSQAVVPTAEDNSNLAMAGDPFTTAGAARIEKWATHLGNGLNEGYFKGRRGAHAIGEAAKGYADADISAEGTRVPNRVAIPENMPLQVAPTVSTDLPNDVEGDDMAFALWIEKGDDGALGSFIEAWAHFYGGPDGHQAFGQTVIDTRDGVQEWTDVGVNTVAPALGEFLRWFEEAGEAVSTLVKRAANFQTAFARVERDHPPSWDIKQAYEDLLAAVRQNPQNPKTVKKARDDWIAITEKARSARERYRSDIEALVPDTGFDLGRPPDIASPTLAAVGSDISPPPPSPRVASGPETSGAGPATNGAGPANNASVEKSDTGQAGADDGEGTNDGENSAEDLRNALSRVEEALGNTGAENPGVEQAENPAGNAGNQNQAVDPNAAQLAQLAGAQNQGLGQNAGAPFDDSAFDDPLGGYGPSAPGAFGGGPFGGVGGGGGPLGGLRNPDTRTAALSGTTNSNSSAPPKLASAKEFGSVASRGVSDKGTFGGPGGMMPMGMPLGGAGTGQNGGGNPKTFEPPAPVVAEDKLPKGLEHHTVNEKPPVVPDATKETLLAAGRKSDTNQGGTPA